MPKQPNKTAAPAAPAAPDRAAALAAAVNPPPASSGAENVESVATLRGLTGEQIAARVRAAASTVASTHILTAKLLVVMDEQRKGKGTLAAYARKETGIEIDPSAYKAAVAFGMVGEGHGHIAESDYDACRLRWLITTSKILNVLADDPDETFAAKTRETVAVVLRERKENAAKLLEAIYKAIKPAKDGDGDGAGDADGDEESADAKLAGVIMLPAFTPQWYKALLSSLESMTDPAMLEMAKGGFGSLSLVAEDRIANGATQLAAAA